VEIILVANNLRENAQPHAKQRAVSMTTKIVRRQLLYSLVWSCSLFCSATAFAQVLETGFVLLNNDRCLDGRVELVADRCIVTKTEGNQVSIPRSQVQFIGSSKKELYRFKSRTLSPRSRAGDHFKLAQWCLSMQLLSEAGHHYLRLIETHPPQTHSSVKRLGVEIKDAMLQQPDFRSHLGLAPLNAANPTIQSASATVSSVVPAGSAATFPAQQLPVQVKALFVDQVQPILLNRCGQASCHGHAAGNSFRLEPVLGVEAASKSQSNMESVLTYISRTPEASSVLLEYATQPHGNRSVPPIAQREARLAIEIDRWIRFCQSQVVTAEAISLATPAGLRPVLAGSAEYRPVPNPSVMSTNAPRMAFSDNELASIALNFPVGAEVPTADELDQLDQMITQQTGFPPLSGGVSSQDPFDPAEFHRMRAAAAATRQDQPSDLDHSSDMPLDWK